MDQGVKELTDADGRRLLVSYARLKGFPLYVIAQVETEKAFIAQKVLINKSVYTAIFIFTLAMFLALLLASSITKPIEILFEAMKKVGKGDFSSRADVAANDEVGVLATSFNVMAQKIEQYTAELKDKIRMESELRIAQLVQSSYFPANYLYFNDMQISAFYQPASECGGDWWGVVEIDQYRKLVCIGDATGHGVAAALMTSTVYSCVNGLKDIAVQDPSLWNSTARIMEIINRAVCRGSRDILMTFFVAIVDSKEKTIKYSNAGHNPPVHYIAGKQPASRTDFEPLGGAVGLRLGVNERAHYQEISKNFTDGDMLMMYTDGLIDGSNSQGKKWGLGSFIRTLLTAMDKNVRVTIDKIVSAAFAFYGEAELSDDVAVVTVKLGPKKLKMFNQIEGFILSRPYCEDALDRSSADLILVDAREKDETLFTDKSVVVRADTERMLNLLMQYPVFNIIGGGGDIDRELAKIITAKREERGICLRDYFLEDSIMRLEISSLPEFLPQMESFIREHQAAFGHSSYIKYMRFVALELLKNAIYNAPVDAEGVRLYSYSENVILKKQHMPNLALAINEEYWAVAVKDNFGRLQRQRVVECLRNGLSGSICERCERGAGLGLFMVLKHSHQLIMNVKKGKEAEIICVVENSKRYKDYTAKRPSFHFYQEG